ncbi:Ankyrin repeat and LEM domain-containing protein 1 [Trichoplax sp. H2]|nr:Ankyrin repeat and LEM domain-containing protein 1 [Trichoplax sp. H2]|eukprot:RDD43740.1 Ankyrin repeat and LEM domain-containing protein 1 [Trichoplax sp. H2]
MATLFKLGADPNHPDDTFGSPFHLAVANANPQNASALIATMLRAGADPNLRATDEGLTPLHVAAAWARPRCLQQLISHGGDPSITTACGQTVSELIDDITNDDDRSICKSVIQRAPYTTGSLYGKSKRRVSGKLNTASLLSARRKIFNDNDDKKENVDNIKFTSSSQICNDLPQPENKPNEYESNSKHSFAKMSKDNGYYQTAGTTHKSPYSTAKNSKLDNLTLITSSPRLNSEQIDQLSLDSSDSVVYPTDVSENYDSTFCDVTGLENYSYSYLNSFGENNSQAKLSKMVSNSFQSSSSSFYSISSIECSDADDVNQIDPCVHKRTDDSDEISDAIKNKLLISTDGNIANQNSKQLSINNKEHNLSTKFNSFNKSTVSDESETNELFSYTPEIKSPKYHHNQNLARINKEVASLEVTNLTENDSYNATSEAITLQQEGPSDEEIWSNYVSDGNSIESESDTIIYDWNEICSRLSLASSDLSKGNFEEEVEIPSVMLSWSNDKIRQELKDYGEIPGPITATTKKVYLTYIVKLKQQIYNQTGSKSTIIKYPPEISTLLKTGNITEDMAKLEQELKAEFQHPDPNRKWREGTAKHSFNYLLLDSRITKNLPSRSKGCSDTELMKDFIRAVFYIGKGQKARPFAHFYEAIKATDSPAKKSGKKVERIQEIWNEGLGIISLHCFQSVIPVEAYTREAAMIDAIGISNLTNERKGDYYGVARTWVHVKRRKLGAYLLYRAMKILLNEGERPLFQGDFHKRNKSTNT